VKGLAALGTAFVLLASLLPLGCGGGSEGAGMARLRRSGKLRWGGDVQGGEPYVYEDPQRPGRLIGFEVDIADALAHELGLRAEFVQNDWSNLIPSLERGTFDVAMNGIEVTPQRAARVSFTRPYYIFGERLMARRNDPSITGLASLRGKRAGTLANSMAWEMLRTAGADAVPYEGTEEPYIDLVSGRTDAVLLDDIIADRYGAPKPGLRVVGDVGTGFYSVAAQRGEPDVRDAVDGAIAHIAASGKLHRILDKWHIDSERQTQIVAWTAANQRSMLREAPSAALSSHHVVLFAEGALVTLLVSIGAMLLAIPLGMALALARRGRVKILQWIAGAYIEVFRGTPVLLQLYVLYYGLASFVRLEALWAAVLGLGLNYAAYEAEVYRAGIQAVPPGQMEAASALGMSRLLAWRRVLIPQAFRLALPGVTNDFIALLKDSSLVSVITVVELTKQMTITAVDVRGWLLPGALCAGMYFAMSYPLSVFSRRLETRLARG